MKKLLLVLAIVLAVSVIFVSCNRDDKGTTPDTTTEAPTTGAPVVEDPTTEAPTTDGAEDPTTEAPTTDGGEETTTEAPTDEDPTTEAPTDEDPTTEAPTDDLPGEDPTTEAPTDDLPSEDPTTEAPTDDLPGEDPTTEAPTEAPTDAPVEETIPFIGIISDINGLGKDGKKINTTNTFQETPHTFNPVTYYYPTVGDAWDYTARRLAVHGWALIEGGQGDLVWSDDGGHTWRPVDKFSFSDATDVEVSKMGEFAKVGGLKTYNTFDMHFYAEIDLSKYYDDDEYVTIWIGRENADGKAVAIFKFSEMLIGEEVYVAESHEECGHVAMMDMRNPVYIVSFDVFKSANGYTDAGGHTDRLRIWDRLDGAGNVAARDDSIGNNTPYWTWNKVVRLIEKDITPGHIFTIEGWVGFNSAYGTGMDHTNVDFTIEVYRNGVLHKINNGDPNPVSMNPGVGAVLAAGNLPGGSLYKLWLGAEDLQNGDSLHVIMTHTAADGTQTKYCIKDFTIQIVPNDTDLTIVARG